MAAALLALLCLLAGLGATRLHGLRFGDRGTFKIVQVADMHFANGAETRCLDVLPDQYATCSDLNTTAFVNRMIKAEKPDLIVFTGDNIYAADASNPEASLDAAFAPAVEAKLPWAAVLGNHDQESALNRSGVMTYIAKKKFTLSRVNPDGVQIDGFGNYNLKVLGSSQSELENKSVLDLFFVDSGDYSTVPGYAGYGWIKESQQLWVRNVSADLENEFKAPPFPQSSAAPALVFFHIPLPEFSNFSASDIVGVKQEGISCPRYNSGFFSTLSEIESMKAAFIGHDHKNDFCGKLESIQLCYAGGFGYHAYGEAGWSRRSRVIEVALERITKNNWGAAKTITTWKRLDDSELSTVDRQILWTKGGMNHDEL